MDGRVSRRQTPHCMIPLVCHPKVHTARTLLLSTELMMTVPCTWNFWTNYRFATCLLPDCNFGYLHPSTPLFINSSSLDGKSQLLTLLQIVQYCYSSFGNNRPNPAPPPTPTAHLSVCLSCTIIPFLWRHPAYPFMQPQLRLGGSHKGIGTSLMN